MSPKTTPKAESAATGRLAANVRRPRRSVAARATTDFPSHPPGALRRAAIGSQDALAHGSVARIPAKAKEPGDAGALPNRSMNPGWDSGSANFSRILSAEFEVVTNFHDVDVGFDADVTERYNSTAHRRRADQHVRIAVL